MATGFGKWSVVSIGPVSVFEFMIDVPPTLIQESAGIKVESKIHVRRTEEDERGADLGGLNVWFWPGAPIFDESGRLNYDERYGRATWNCPVEDINLGETVTCTAMFVERHPEWVQDSYWSIDHVSVAAWPSQTTSATN